jgi:branched-chain amino acid transport system permease protein
MGSNLLIVVFAVVVIGGMGSVFGSVVTGLALGLLEGIAKLIYPEFANTVVFLIMVVVLLTRPAGLFGRQS